VSENLVESKASRNHFNLNDAVIIGAFTLLGYIWSYNYALGQKGYYHIPDMFIEIDLTAVIKAVGALFGILYLIYILLILLFEFYPKKENALSNSVRKLIWYFILCVALSFANGHLVGIIAGAIAFFLFLFIELGLPLFFKKQKSYIAKLEENQSKSPYAFFSYSTNKLGRNFVYLIIFFLFAYLGSDLMVQLGSRDASKEKEYLLINLNTPMVVLDTYKDSLLVADVDLQKKEIIPNYRIIRINEASKDNVRFEARKIGPLKVRELTTN
jgi:signal transduction histidine kinase